MGLQNRRPDVESTANTRSQMGRLCWLGEREAAPWWPQSSRVGANSPFERAAPWDGCVLTVVRITNYV